MVAGKKKGGAKFDAAGIASTAASASHPLAPQKPEGFGTFLSGSGEAEELLRSIIDQAVAGIAVADFDGRFLAANPKCQDLFGYTQDELKDLTFLALSHPEDIQATKVLVGELLAGKIPEYALEKRYIRKDGTEFWSHTRVTIFKDSAGTPRFMVGILEDITRRKIAEQKLRDESRVLEILNQTGAAIASKIKLRDLAQVVVDAATDLTGAEVGAFFYSIIESGGEIVPMQAVCGVPDEDSKALGLLRAAPELMRLLSSEGILRIADISSEQSSRSLFGQIGGAPGEFSIRSFLAVPVISRSGEAQGGLFFGHSHPGAFTERSEELTKGIASQAAIAIDNANLIASAHRESAERHAAGKELEETQRELRSQQQRLESIFRFSEDAIITKSLQGVIQSWNRSAERIFGYTAAEMIGRSIYTLVPDDLRWQEDDILKKIARGERVEHLETERVAKGGRRIFISVTSSPIKDNLGTIVGATKIARDITDRRQQQVLIEQSEARYRALAEERSRLLESESKARASVEEANRVKDRFLATLSHELRTPLNAIMGWSQIAAKDVTNTARVIEGLEIIRKNARSQAQIIEDLLDMNRIVSGTLTLQKQPLELRKLVEEAIQTVLPLAHAKEIEISTEFLADGCFVEVDATRMTQVIWNILTNAIKFTGKAGAVKVAATQEGGMVTLAVTDSGEGIRAEFLPFIFDRFTQADTSTSRRFGGLGLGLSIVRHLVELHGGKIAAYSAGPGTGAEFRVTIPLAADQKISPPLFSGRENGDFKDLEGLRALVIDDEEDARMLLKTALGDRGADVAIAKSAEEGIRLLASGKFDVVISDIGMPTQDGYEFMRKVRSIPHCSSRNLPAIAVTAYARPEDRNLAIEAGFQTHMTKPVDPGELATVIRGLTR